MKTLTIFKERKNKLLEKLKKISIFGFLLLIVFSFLGINIYAQAGSPVKSGCNGSADLAIKEISLRKLYNINNFLPLVPEGCAYYGTQLLDVNGKPKKDSSGIPVIEYKIRSQGVAFLADLVLRLVGFVFAIGFYLIPFFIVVLGFLTIFVSYLPNFNVLNLQTFSSSAGANQTISRFIVDKILSLVAGIILLHVAYAIVFTILGIIGLGNIAESTNINNFFS